MNENLNENMNEKLNRPGDSTKKTGEEEQAFLDNVRSDLDRSCDRLDGHTQSRLNSIRHAAVEHGHRHPGRAMLAPFGGLVTACVLVVVVSLFFRQPESPVPVIQDNRNAIEDLDILTSSESLEFFENLEFFQWLEENEVSI
jgi:hypothetical protein